MPCKLRTTCTDLWCQFCALPGSQVTLVAVGTQGTILFQSARYDGQELVTSGPTAEVTFGVKSGRKLFIAAYAFSQGSNGRGELHERCTPTQTNKLDDLTGLEPLRRHRICGE